MAIFRQRFVIGSPFPVDEARKKLLAVVKTDPPPCAKCFNEAGTSWSRKSRWHSASEGRYIDNCPARAARWHSLSPAVRTSPGPTSTINCRARILCPAGTSSPVASTSARGGVGTLR